MQLLPNATPRVIDGVPDYLWRHGCGPTAVGMVVGYYDSHGYSDLYPGEGATQTSEVDQCIASQGSGIRGSGLQQHYEDYSLPMDSGSPTVLADRSATFPAGCHTDDCIGDFMHTSWSKDGNYYGWSWSNRIAPAFTSFVALRNSGYGRVCAEYRISSLSWGLLVAEIDAGRPMVFLVDSDGDGGTDHFVTVVGYSDSPDQQYGCLDTWSPAGIRWCRFRGMSSSYAWGVWGGWTFMLQPIKPADPTPGMGGYEPPVGTLLSWSNGGGAASYDVYLGTTPAPGESEFKGNQPATTFDPGALAPDTTYYWRIDARGTGGGVTRGDVWQFTTSNGLILGDFNIDGDVDQEDFGHLQACLTANLVMAADACLDADLDTDGDVDPMDYALFAACFSGPRPARPGCGN
jgi:hypothetical protein